MGTKLLGRVVLMLSLALLVLPSAAWADQKVTFSDGGTINVDSDATATATGDNPTATAVSNSYNTSLEGVTSQTLTATVADTTTTVGGDGMITNGNAIATTDGGSSGVIQTGANSGISGIVQQGMAFGTAGSIALP
jgi:hypothetical protein